MCGIVGIVSSDDVNQQIYDSLLLCSIEVKTQQV